MAERVTVESVLKKISQRDIECQLCMDRFKEPKMLECSHAYCQKCLQQLAETDPTSPKLICPVCRAETSLSGKGVVDLQTDLRLTSMLDEIEQHETELQKQQAIQPPSSGSVSKCSKHPGKDVIMYCDSCKQLICTTCIAKDHKMHPATELNEVVDNCKKKANEILAAVAQHHITFKIAMEDIGMSRKTLDSMFASTKAQIAKKADEKIAEEVARIREEENNLVVELAQTYKDKATQIETALATNNNDMTKAKNNKVAVNQHMDEVNFFENLHLIENLLQDLEDYTEIQPKQVTSDLTYIDFEDDQKSLGRLRIKEEQKLEGAASAAARKLTQPVKKKLTQQIWTLKTELTTYMNTDQQIQDFCALDVASFCNGDIVVCDIKSRTLIKISADNDAQSKVFAKELSIKGLTNPSRVTVNKNDELIVVDNTKVKIFNRTYKCLRELKLGGQQPIQPSCIAVDDNNLIAVGYERLGDLSLHKPDGSLITTLPAPRIGGTLTIHKQQLIYTNKFGKKMVSVDYNGGIVFSVDFKQSKYPRGLCCNKDGSIYVDVWDCESSAGEIHHYSPDGQYIGCIIKGCTDPNGITITPAGDLVVATYASVKIYSQK
ncbi:tripartite motif-containing 13-like isoform X1 [Asterias rubens]|uniref:tripartite motif-containing 13-like isoform X1 n=1 Tax=Asterias rubens TaxID=7604 RepID=UPI0014557F5B|nr:tripartite motif-containing 13-like isoform X1 [Asterias rubens]